MIHIMFLFTGFMVGILYYHHIWLAATWAHRKRWIPLLSFWFRYGLLAMVLTVLFKTFPGGRLTLIIGLFSGRPAYLFINKQRIFRGEDGE